MRSYSSVPIRRQQVLLFVVDLALLLLSFMLSLFIARYARFDLVFVFAHFATALAICFGIYLPVFFVGQLYDVESRYDEMRSFIYICGLVAAAGAGIVAVYRLFPYWDVAWRIVAIQAPLVVIFIYLWRRIYALVSQGLVSARRVLVVGPVGGAEPLLAELRQRFAPELRIAGIVNDPAGEAGGAGVPGVEGIARLGGARDLKSIVQREGIETIVMSQTFRSASDGDLVRDLLDLKAHGIQVFELPTFYMRATGKVPVGFIEERWLVFSQDFAGVNRADERNLKRLMDVLIAAGALVLLSPLMLALAVMIRLTSRGPALFRQERVGLDRKPYRLLKFRTMRADAEGDGAPRWASPDDDRVTPLGRFMRRLRLDETPQFINVLRGEMSVIGPRPERPYFVERLERDVPYYGLRFAVRPGMTGWAQVNHPYGASVQEARGKLEYDLYYIQEMSPALDLVILLKTLQTVLFRPGR